MRSLMFAAAVAVLSLSGCKSREEKLKAAEDEGNLLVATKAKLLKGAADAVKKEGKEAAESLAEGTGEVVKGIGSGIEKGFKEVKIAAHESLATQGLTATRATRGEEGTAAHTVTVYMTFEKAWAGAVELRAYDSQEREVGRAKVELDEKESNAHYVDFVFDARTPLLTAGKFDLRAVPKS
jgi:hypothetical protein